MSDRISRHALRVRDSDPAGLYEPLETGSLRDHLEQGTFGFACSRLGPKSRNPERNAERLRSVSGLWIRFRVSRFRSC